MYRKSFVIGAAVIAVLLLSLYGGRSLRAEPIVSRTLYPGWNLFSYLGASAPVGTALQEVSGSYSQVCSLDGQEQDWDCNDPSAPAPLNELQQLERYSAYAIFMTSQDVITFDLGSSATPSATPTPTVTPTPIVTPTPTPGGSYTVVFSSFYNEPNEFSGAVTGVQLMDTILGGGFYDPISAPPGANFAVVFMNVTNFGGSPDDVGIFSVRLRDSSNRIFTMDFEADILAQLTAEEYFDRTGTYETIQPGVTASMVLVFLTPDNSSGLIVQPCPESGCEAGATSPPAPPGGCSVVFPSFYTESDTFCATDMQINRVNTIPGSDFLDPVTAPAGTDFAVVFLTVYNYGFTPSYVGSFSVRLRDSSNNLYTMDFDDDITVQLTAEAYYERSGSYETIQPGITVEMVLIFLVPESASGLNLESCPGSGCD